MYRLHFIFVILLLSASFHFL